jgi:hypothetical protein
MKKQPKQTAGFVLDLLADDKKREVMQARARELMARLHSPDAFNRAMDTAFDSAVKNRFQTVA